MGEYMVSLVGEASYQPAVKRCRRGDVVRLIPEPDNPFDADAVKALTVYGETVGYLPRGHWAGPIVTSGTPEHLAVVAHVTGGTRDKPSRGIVLALFTADEARAMRARAGERAGAGASLGRLFARLIFGRR